MERKFTSAMQKASQIENIINKPQKYQHHSSNDHHTATDVAPTPAWLKRQTSNANIAQPPPPPASSLPTAVEKRPDFVVHVEDCFDGPRSKNYVNPEEYQFFINAIEKLKATNLFHEEDIKRMSDEQIYDALVEHARKQKLKQRLMAAHQLSMSTAASSSLSHSTPAYNPTNAGLPPESIDPKEDEEDLPIIMKNLHSVKSLKHFFEIRAKSTAAATSAMTQQFNSGSCGPGDHHFSGSATNSPLLNPRISRAEFLASSSPPPPPPPLPSASSSNGPSYDMFMKSSNPLIEKSIKHGMGLVNKVNKINFFC